MSRSIALLVATLALAACTETTAQPTKTPTSTTSITSGAAPSSHTGQKADPSERREDDGDDLRN